MKVLGLDLGDASLGLAISDNTQTIARGLENYRFDKDDFTQALNKVKSIVAKEPISIIVLGYPKNMDNTIGVQAQKTKHFKTMLNEHLDIPVILKDERLTSKLAGQTMIFAKKARKKRKKSLDQMSAVILLQQYLDEKKEVR